jgi:hypothetical protein
LVFTKQDSLRGITKEERGGTWSIII